MCNEVHQEHKLVPQKGTEEANPETEEAQESLSQPCTTEPLGPAKMQ